MSKWLWWPATPDCSTELEEVILLEVSWVCLMPIWETHVFLVVSSPLSFSQCHISHSPFSLSNLFHLSQCLAFWPSSYLKASSMRAVTMSSVASIPAQCPLESLHNPLTNKFKEPFGSLRSWMASQKRHNLTGDWVEFVLEQWLGKCRLKGETMGPQDVYTEPFLNCIHSVHIFEHL